MTGAGPPAAAPQHRGANRSISRCSAASSKVPTDQPEADGTLAWEATTMVLVQVSAGGTTARVGPMRSAGCQAVVDSELDPVMLGADPMDVVGITEAMVRTCRNLGRPGLVSCAVSAADTALWDLKARLLGQPLTALFGRCLASLPVYGSGGFTTYSDAMTVTQLERWVGELGVRWVKIKIGESWGTATTRDLARVSLALPRGWRRGRALRRR